jgi:hypothetical protein
VVSRREQFIQLARLSGYAAFAGRFGPPHTAQPQEDAIRAFIDEHIEELARGLVEEAAASDDITDKVSAESYLADRLAFFDNVLTDAQASSIRDRFRTLISSW